MEFDSQNLNVAKYFPSLEDALVEELNKYGHVRTAKKGEVLVKTGQFIVDSLLVLDGLIKVYREDEEGNEFFMYYLQQGQACALTMNCAIRQEKSPVIAIAVQETKLLSLPLQMLDEWMRKYPSWNHFVLDNYRTRYMDLLQSFDQVAFRHMDERLEYYLKRYADKLKISDIEVTHQEIANELNSSREVISRLLKKLADDGKIRLHRYHIEIVNL
jgi:CRP/FNR family transcriptional regulator